MFVIIAMYFFQSRLELIHNSPEKLDQFCGLFEAHALPGHYVLRSPGETG